MPSLLPGIAEQQGAGINSYKLSFNGSNNCVTLPTSTLSGVRSITFWIKLNSVPEISDTILNRNITASNSNRFLMSIDGSGRLEVTNWGGAGSLTNRRLSSNLALLSGRWIHIGYSIDPTAGAKLYLNGVQQTATASDTNAITSVNGTISMMCDAFFGIRYVHGDIKEIKFFTNALTQEDIVSEMTYHPNGLELGLKEYFNLIEGSGLITTGIKGTIATLTSATMWEETPYTDYNHLTFKSINKESINLGNTISDGIRNLSFWFKSPTEINSGSPSSVLLSRFEPPGTVNGRVSVEFVSGKILCNFYTGQSFVNFFSNNNLWSAGVWYHLAVNINATSGTTMYVNSVAQTNTVSGNTNATTTLATQNTYLGGRVSNGTFYSNIDIKGLKFWTTSRTQVEIQSDMTSIPNGTETGLKAYFPLLQLEGNKIYDFKDAYSGTITSLGVINDMWQLTN